MNAPWDSRPNAKSWCNLCHHSLCDLTCSLAVEAGDGPATEAGSLSRVRMAAVQEWSWYFVMHKVRTVRPSQVKETKALQGKGKIKASFAGVPGPVLFTCTQEGDSEERIQVAG